MFVDCGGREFPVLFDLSWLELMTALQLQLIIIIVALERSDQFEKNWFIKKKGWCPSHIEHICGWLISWPMVKDFNLRQPWTYFVESSSYIFMHFFVEVSTWTFRKWWSVAVLTSSLTKSHCSVVLDNCMKADVSFLRQCWLTSVSYMKE